MSLQNLRSFVEVYRCLSITEAARNLGLTQPAVSQHIAGLETQLGRKLFVREARGVRPTGVAEDLAAQIGDGLDRAEAALAGMKARSAQVSGTVHLAGPPELMAEWLAPHLGRLSEAGLRMRVHLGGRAALYDMLLAAEVDLALTASEPDDARLAGQQIGMERLLLVARPDMAGRLTGAADLGVALREVPMVAYDADLPLVRHWAEANGLDMAGALPAVTAPDIRLLRGLVEAGVGWTVMPDYLCADGLSRGTMAEVTATATPENAFYLVWVKSALRHPRVAFTRQLLLEAFG